MMLTPDEIADILAHAERRGIRALAVEEPGFALRLEFPAPCEALSAPRPDPQPAQSSIPIKATGFGRLLAAAPLSGADFAGPGRHVEQGEIVALLQVGPLYRPVRAPAPGIVEARLVEPGALVGYGDEILRLRPTEDQAR